MNHIRAIPPPPADCPVVRDPEAIAVRHGGMLADESRLRADPVRAVFLPRSAEELAGALQTLSREGKTCVISGGRTGITGGAVPVGADAVVSLEGMKKILGFSREGGQYCVRAEAGATLTELEEWLARQEISGPSGTSLWFPVDPTERSAQLGGMVATNASGPRTYRFGSTRDWVQGLSLVLPDGGLVRVRRGEVQADGRLFRITDTGGSTRDIILPDIAVPRVKHAAGYFVKPGMDLVDLLAGSEGTLGAFADVELRLAEKPEAAVGVLIGTKDEGEALDLVERARCSAEPTLQAIEYFDADSLRLLDDKRREEGTGSPTPEVPFAGGAAVYLEIAGPEKAVVKALTLLEKLFLSLGLSLDRTWAARDEKDRGRQRDFRHAVPEAVNAWIGRRKQADPDLHKVGTDFAVPDGGLREMFSLYRQGLRDTGLTSVVFGHIGNNHVHVNVLPRNAAEMQKAEGLYLRWAREAVRLGGTVSGEHGIGRLKKNLLALQYPPDVLEAMRRLRKAFDPAGTLAPGVLL